MTAAEWVVVTAAIVLSLAVVGWMLFTRRDPERAATHEEGRFRTGNPTERPADAGAESLRVDSHDNDTNIF